MTIKERVEKLKASTGWSDARLGAQLGVSAPTVCRWRTGTQPRAEVIKRLEELERNPTTETPPKPPAPDPLEARLESMDRQLSEIRGILLGQRNPFTVQEPLGPVAPRTQRKNTKPLPPQ